MAWPYIDDALSVLKQRADEKGLIVDADGTAALTSLLRGALIRAIDDEAGLGSSIIEVERKHEGEFAETAELLAEEATSAARQDNSRYVNHLHIEMAVAKLAALGIWPFTGD